MLEMSPLEVSITADSGCVVESFDTKSCRSWFCVLGRVKKKSHAIRVSVAGYDLCCKSQKAKRRHIRKV